MARLPESLPFTFCPLKAARLVQGLLGVVFLVAGASKIQDPVLFFWHAFPYTEVVGLAGPESLLAARAALLLGPLECFLGLALLANWQPNVVFSASSVLLLFFFGLTFLAWHQGLDAGCGCFGALIERGPGEAAIENLVLFGLLTFAWWGTGLLNRSAGIGGRYLVLGGTALALVIGGLRFFPEVYRLEGSDLQVGVHLGDVKMEGVNLDQGDYLVEVFSPACPRCTDAVPELNAFQDTPGVPPVVALTVYDRNSDVVADFVKRYQPEYTIATVSRKDFVRLSWRHGYPRLALVRDGVVRRVWEHDALPTREELDGLFGIVAERR